jgi:uncharacterized protein YbjQ (UPF0145 family)
LPRPPADDDARVEASIEALRRGDLPLVAKERIERLRAQPGAFTSDLSVDEFAAIRSVGFDAVSQVMGSSVYQIGFGGSCPARGSRGVFSVAELMPYSQALYQARWLALNRLSQEAAGVGGHGVVGVHLNMRYLEQSMGIMEYTAIGTAVRRAGAPPLEYPFLSALSGQEFAKLLRAGYVPAGLVMGVAALQIHTGWSTAFQSGSWQNQELGQFTEAVGRARQTAMTRLEQDISRYGADGCVGSDVGMQVWPVPCYYRMGGQREELEDHVVQFFAIGTAVVRFSTSQEPDRPALLMRLDLNRRSVEA